MKSPSLKEKADLFAKFSEPPQYPKTSAYCEDSPSVIHNPDNNATDSSQAKAKPPMNFKAKKIKSLGGVELKHPKTEDECNSFLVESMQSYGEGDFSTTFEETINNLSNNSSKASGLVKSNWPKNIEDVENRPTCKVLSQSEMEDAKDRARIDAMTEAERDAYERFGGLS